MTGYIDPAGKLFGHMDRLLELRRGRVPAPVNVEIDLSNRCSLGCEWCHFAYTHTRGPLTGKRPKPAGAVPGGDLMQTSLAFSIVRDLAAAGVESITWTGGGEPTLHPDFDSILAYANTKIQQGLYTHGGHITSERAELLKRVCTFVYVSLDAADANAYKAAKGVDRFAAACEGIRLLAAAQGDATIGVGYLVTRDNWKDIPTAALLVGRLGADYLQLRPTIRYDETHPQRRDEDTDWLDNAIPAIATHMSRDPNIVADLDRFRDYRDWSGHGYRTCFWAGLQTVITPNGKIWSCVNKREHAAAEIGDLSTETFADAWARRPLPTVENTCRVMCRGHLANVALDSIMRERPHAAFI